MVDRPLNHKNAWAKWANACFANFTRSRYAMFPKQAQTSTHICLNQVLVPTMRSSSIQIGYQHENLTPKNTSLFRFPLENSKE